jgi:hypothetical protein
MGLGPLELRLRGNCSDCVRLGGWEHRAQKHALEMRDFKAGYLLVRSLKISVGFERFVDMALIRGRFGRIPVHVSV